MRCLLHPEADVAHFGANAVELALDAPDLLLYLVEAGAVAVADARGTLVCSTRAKHGRRCATVASPNGVACETTGNEDANDEQYAHGGPTVAPAWIGASVVCGIPSPPECCTIRAARKCANAHDGRAEGSSPLVTTVVTATGVQ